MDLLRLGFNLENPSKNPVTISVTVDWDIDPPDYKGQKFQMLAKLQVAGFPDVQVDFERGDGVADCYLLMD